MECLQEKLLLEFVSVEENIFLKAVTPFQVVFFQSKEVFCKDCFMKGIGEQELQLSLLQINCMNVGSAVMFIACADGIVFRILTLIKDSRQIKSQPKKGKKDSTSVRHLIIL